MAPRPCCCRERECCTDYARSLRSTLPLEPLPMNKNRTTRPALLALAVSVSVASLLPAQGQSDRDSVGGNSPLLSPASVQETLREDRIDAEPATSPGAGRSLNQHHRGLANEPVRRVTPVSGEAAAGEAQGERPTANWTEYVSCRARGSRIGWVPIRRRCGSPLSAGCQGCAALAWRCRERGSVEPAVSFVC
jgi:hypothetical protein